MHKTALLRLFRVLGFAVLVGPVCSRADLLPVRQAPVLAALPADPALQPKSILPKKVVARVNDAVVGELRRGASCDHPTPVRFNAALVNSVSRAFGRLYRQKIGALGYPVMGAATRSAFDSEMQRRDHDFELGITLRQLEVQLCAQGPRQTQGGVWMQLRWEVFSPWARKVVLDITTEGSYQSSGAEQLGVSDMYDRAFLAAANNLLAQSAYFDLMHGRTAVPEPEKFQPLRLKVAPAAEGSVEANYQQLVDATVTLTDGRNSGSGFLISGEGYLLTNHHVVGARRSMKVRFNDGTEQVATLVRANRVRDVALLKVSTRVPAPLHLGLRQPTPGEEAYVIGSPLGKTFAGTLTRGIVSGVRQLQGVNYIQSDVRILPGSSGGPLIDARSQVIGMTVSGINAGLAGINLFIPIEEALQALGIELE